MIIYTWKVNRVRRIKKRVGLFKKRTIEIKENLIDISYTNKDRALSNMNLIDSMNIDGFRRYWLDAVDIVHDGPYKKSPEIDGYYETYVTEEILFED